MKKQNDNLLRGKVLMTPGLAMMALALCATCVAAQTQPNPGPVEFEKIAREGQSLKLAEAEAMEKSLAQSPEDISARVRLLGYYFASARQELDVEAIKSARARHILWMVSHHPESSALDLSEVTIDPEVGPLADAQGYDHVRHAWLEKTAADTAPVAVLTHAARFLQVPDPESTIRLLRRASGREPENEELKGRLILAYALSMAGVKLLNQNGLPLAGDASLVTAPLAVTVEKELVESANASVIAAAARLTTQYGIVLYADKDSRAGLYRRVMRLMQRAVELDPKMPGYQEELYGLRMGAATSDAEKLALRKKRFELEEQDLAKVTDRSNRVQGLAPVAIEAFECGDLDTAQTLASELLKLLPDFKSEWYYGTLLYQANTILGRVAVRRGSIELAAKYLLDSGNVSPGGTMTSFGPNMLLAKDLLEKGQQRTVLQFLDEVSRFCSFGSQSLPEWRREIEEGKLPQFGPNLAYDWSSSMAALEERLAPVESESEIAVKSAPAQVNYFLISGNKISIEKLSPEGPFVSQNQDFLVSLHYDLQDASPAAIQMFVEHFQPSDQKCAGEKHETEGGELPRQVSPPVGNVTFHLQWRSDWARPGFPSGGSIGIGMRLWANDEDLGAVNLRCYEIEAPVESKGESAVKSTLLPAPALLLPANGAVFNVYPRATVLSWAPVSSADHYTAEVDCFHCCQAGRWCSDVGGATTLIENISETRCSFNFVGAQPGRWRVWAVDKDGRAGSKSAWREFRYTQ